MTSSRLESSKIPLTPPDETSVGRTEPELVALIQRVADRQTAAFRALHQALKREVHERAIQETADLIGAGRVACGTFLELWYLAAAHAKDQVIRPWVSAVVHRRADEYGRQPGNDSPLTVEYHRHSQRHFASLLRAGPDADR